MVAIRGSTRVRNCYIVHYSMLGKKDMIVFSHNSRETNLKVPSVATDRIEQGKTKDWTGPSLSYTLISQFFKLSLQTIA